MCIKCTQSGMASYQSCISPSNPPPGICLAHFYLQASLNDCIRVCVCVRVRVCVCVAEARMSIFNTFVPSTKTFISNVKGACLQHQKCSSQAQYMFVASDKHFRLQCDLYLEVSIAATISSLVINAFVCSSMKSYSVVGSRDCLVASDKHNHLLFGSWFRNPPKRNRN